jgi:hypothetical protein
VRITSVGALLHNRVAWLEGRESVGKDLAVMLLLLLMLRFLLQILLVVLGEVR